MDKLIPKTTALAAVEVAFWNDDLAGAQKMIEEAEETAIVRVNPFLKRDDFEKLREQIVGQFGPIMVLPQEVELLWPRPKEEAKQ